MSSPKPFDSAGFDISATLIGLVDDAFDLRLIEGSSANRLCDAVELLGIDDSDAF